MLHDLAASPVHCQLGLVQIRLLGHVHSADFRGALGLLFEFHWHPVLPCLLRCAPHWHLSRSNCSLCPQNFLPPLLWLQAALAVHQSQCIKSSLRCTWPTHLDTNASVSNASGALSSKSNNTCSISNTSGALSFNNSCSISATPATSCSMHAFLLAASFMCAKKSNTERKPCFARSSWHFLCCPSVLLNLLSYSLGLFRGFSL
jgi:hypothetical protein